jgi:hypothetical protein
MLGVAMMLQRSPVMRFIAQSQFSIFPRVQHMWKAVVAGITVGAYNSVTAATGQISIAQGSTSTTVSLGEKIQLVLWVSGEKVGSPYKPELWEVIGTLPTGVQYAANRNAGTLSFTGNPSQVGQFPITAKAYEKTSKSGGSDTFDFTITVQGSGPVFTQQPSNQTVPSGGTLNLSAAVDITNGTTYQWQRQLSGQANYSNIIGQTGTTLSITNMTTADSGSYRMLATNNGTTIQSNAAVVTVTPPAGPVFTQQPVNQTVLWGGVLNLSAIVDITQGTTYQWQRILSGEAQYSDIQGETGTALSISQLIKSDEGMYRVVATNGANTIQSDSAMVSVTASAFQTWRELNFQDPFVIGSSEGEDPDMDTLTNGIEYTFGFNPNKPESTPLVRCSHEVINNVPYTVFTYPPVAARVDSILSFQGNSGLDPNGWSTLQNGVNGVIIESTVEGYVVKVSTSALRFTRLKVTTN